MGTNISSDQANARCIHIGLIVPREQAPDRNRDWFQCQKGHGIVCPCNCGRCPDRVIKIEEDRMLTTGEVTESTSVEDMIEVIENQPPGGWPKGWSGWANTQAAHLKLLGQFLGKIPRLPEGKYAGQGIVSCVSAKPGHSSGKNLDNGYFPGAWVQIKELRRLGCTLPVTWCYLGPQEWSPRLTKLVEPLGVKVIDLREWERGQNFRILAGWEAKVAAILAAGYDHALFLDADNVPVRDPSPLFADRRYLDKGSVFWPDLPPNDRAEWLAEACWAMLGMEYRDEVDFESGQFLIHVSKCWREVMLSKWILEHSDRFFDAIFGDKSVYHLAWRKLGTDYTLPRTAAGWNGGAILQYDLDGRLLFEHGCQNKPSLRGYPHGRTALSNPGECHAHLDELRSIWNGRLWDGDPDGPAKDMAKKMVGKTYKYVRIGLGERHIRLLEDERIGLGAARCEFGWSVSLGEHGQSVMSISDVDGKITCLLTVGPDEVWRGRWEEYERCQVELIPVK